MSPIPLGIFAASGLSALSAFDLLETIEITANTSDVTFSGLDAYSDYKHLQLRLSLRGDRDVDLLMRFNSDSTASYSRHFLYGNGSAVASSSSTSSTSIGFYKFVSDDTNVGEAAASVIDILDFSNTSKNTTVKGLGGSTTDARSIALVSGVWYNTSPVTSIYLEPGNAVMRASSRLSLYGIKG